MNIGNASLAFTFHVLSKIEPVIISSLTKKQYDAISGAITANAPKSRHPVDVRGVLSLFFVRYYFVILAGRDRRPAIQSLEEGRRREGDLCVSTTLMFFLLMPVILLVLLVYYFIKAELGIDYLPDFHLFDVLSV